MSISEKDWIDGANALQGLTESMRDASKRPMIALIATVDADGAVLVSLLGEATVADVCDLLDKIEAVAVAGEDMAKPRTLN